MDDVLTLVKETITTHDEYGNAVMTTSTRDVFCRISGVSRSEFYSAATAGLKPEITARLSDHADYDGEETAIFHERVYDIVRVFRGSDSYSGMDIGNIELTLQRKIGK